MKLAGRWMVPALLSSMLGACAEGPVRRVVPLVAENGLPAASTRRAGAEVQLDISRLEGMKPGRRLFGWARGGGAWSPVAELVAGPNRLTGPAWDSVEELMVTDEGVTLGATPAPLVVFRGPVGEPLRFAGFGGPTFEELGKATVSAVLEGTTLTAHVAQLPSLSGAAYYAVWLVGTAESGEAPELTFLGRLGADDSQLAGEELLAAHEELRITIELENGTDTQGSVVMRGAVLNLTVSPATTVEAPKSHQH